jgi:hypothetical protein
MAETRLIAPCGMNCGICLGYLRKERHCPGCRGDDAQKMVSCLRCIIKNCENIQTNQSGFCYGCAKYPCRRLKDLDRRYRTKYGMSMIGNLENIRQNGLNAFIETELERWRCPACGGVMCVHRAHCPGCGAERRNAALENSG